MKKTSQKQKTKGRLQPRPPVVVVLGHIDHGKSTLLDCIRKTKLTEKEPGGITQHIGAYQIKGDTPMTFLDTPGHEAFAKVRAYGAQVADVAILVVAADEGVKAQTKEAIKYIKQAKIPLVVAINKMDKPGANPEKVKQELKKQGVVVEDYGGSVPVSQVSAKTGKNIEELLELTALLAALHEVKADPNKKAQGVVIKASLDPQRGPTATFLVKDGTLLEGDWVQAGSTWGRVKLMEDFQGQPLKKAPPSFAAVVIGLRDLPEIGTKFQATLSSQKAQDLARTSQFSLTDQEPVSIETEKELLPVVIKADDPGTLAAVVQALVNLKYKEVPWKIIKKEVGPISYQDVDLAHAFSGLILGFQEKCEPGIKALARRLGIKMIVGDVIYELIENFQKALKEFVKSELVREDLGEVRVLQVFRREKDKEIVGGQVEKGKVLRGSLVEVLRDGRLIARGQISELQHEKKDVSEVQQGKECGILFRGKPLIEKGDILKVYQEHQQKSEI